jgi:malic enzyme
MYFRLPVCPVCCHVLQAIGLPISKLALHTACGGIEPATCMPVVFDVGTDNEELLQSPLYVGVRHRWARRQMLRLYSTNEIGRAHGERRTHSPNLSLTKYVDGHQSFNSFGSPPPPTLLCTHHF